MKLLHIMRTVSPESGGPIEALVQSDPVWRKRGHSREIVSLDAPDDAWVRGCPIKTHAMGSPSVKRLQKFVPWLRYGYTPTLVPWLRAHVDDYDTIVVNGLWNYTDLAARRVLPFQAKPYFVFTHGMLDPWFRQTYPLKHLAKQLSWWIAEGPLLHGARSVLFTSQGERQCAERAFWPYRFSQQVSGYGTADSPSPTAAQEQAFRASVPGLGERPYLLFLGRLHPKKGCDLLLRAFAEVMALDPRLDLVIAGPDTDGWQSALSVQADTLSLNDRLHWPGMLRDEAKWGALHGCAAFVLPSHGENFGIAVIEAMACGRPVLLSDRVNTAPEIIAAGAGLVGPDTAAGTATLLRRFLTLSAAERGAMGEDARRCFLRTFFIESVADDALAILSGQTFSDPITQADMAFPVPAAGLPHVFSEAQA